MLDEAGFIDATITASSDLDEYVIESLILQGEQRLIPGSWHQADYLQGLPTLGEYMLSAVELDSQVIPRTKLSETHGR